MGCAVAGTIRNSYKILVGRSEWKRPLGTARLRWEDNGSYRNRVEIC